jgi:hypothetical protein
MNHVIDKGWAFYWGTSEWWAQQITEAWGIAEKSDLVGPIGGGVGYPRAAIISALSEVLSIVPWFSTIFLD